MKRDEALMLLGLDKCRTTLTPDIVAEAFRASVMKHHPDTQDQAVGPITIRTIDQIKDARELLLKSLDGVSDFACKLCNGLGSVASKVGRRTCSACKGTGDRR